MIEAEKPREDHLKAWYSHVKQPESMNSRIWRYMDFAKFVSMLETQCLFFSRLDCLGDPFEGTVTTPHNERFLSRVTSKSQREEFENMCKIVRTHIFVSCWNLSEHENDALWKIYGLSKESVAVRTSYGKLRSVPNVKAGKVEYVDYKSYSTDMPVAECFAMRKRLCFSHENEVRGLLWKTNRIIHKGEMITSTELPNEFPGIPVPICLADFIEEVVVHPQSETWFFDLVRSLVNRYGVGVNVKRSDLLETPRYSGFGFPAED